MSLSPYSLTISDGRLAPVLSVLGAQPSSWASRRKQKGEMILPRTLVGTHLMAAIRQLGRVCQLVYCNLDWEMAKQKLHLRREGSPSPPATRRRRLH